MSPGSSLRAALVAILIPGLTFAPGLATAGAAQDLPRTRPERTAYAVMAFLESLRLVDPGLEVRALGYSEEGRSLPLAVFGAEPGATAAEIRADRRLRVLVLANIHAGEVAGKEAALVLARELVEGRRDDWLDSVIVLIAPIYNADRPA